MVFASDPSNSVINRLCINIKCLFHEEGDPFSQFLSIKIYAGNIHQNCVTEEVLVNTDNARFLEIIFYLDTLLTQGPAVQSIISLTSSLVLFQ